MKTFLPIDKQWQIIWMTLYIKQKNKIKEYSYICPTTCYIFNTLVSVIHSSKYVFYFNFSIKVFINL
jgi:hypothetical protein